MFKSILKKHSKYLKYKKLLENSNDNIAEDCSYSSVDSTRSNIPEKKRIPIQSRTKDTLSANIKVDFCPVANTIDFALQQYVYNLVEQLSNGATRINSYDAITSESIYDNNDPGNNTRNEKKLLKYIDNNGYNRIEQLSYDGIPSFEHIRSSKFEHNYNRRLYLRCKRENISSISKSLLDELKNKNFYFKFATDDCAARQSKSEQIVFYTSDDELAGTVNSIRRVFSKNQIILKDAFNINPFLKNIDGYIGISPDINDGIYVGAKGKITPIAKSYTSLLAEALEESIVVSCKQLGGYDNDFSYNYHDDYKEDSTNCVGLILSKIIGKPEKFKKFVDEMKVSLSRAEVKNKRLDIKGIEPEVDKRKYYTPLSSVVYQR